MYGMKPYRGENQRTSVLWYVRINGQYVKPLLSRYGLAGRETELEAIHAALEAIGAL